MDIFDIGQLVSQRAESNRAYLEFFRRPSLSMGIYHLRVGELDKQQPHSEDEIYYVVSGNARFKAGSEDREVSAGSVIFVAAEVEHRFYEIEEELAVLVVFAPAES